MGDKQTINTDGILGHIQILQKKDAMAEGEGQDGEDSTRDS